MSGIGLVRFEPKVHVKLVWVGSSSRSCQAGSKFGLLQGFKLEFMSKLKPLQGFKPEFMSGLVSVQGLGFEVMLSYIKFKPYTTGFMTS
jgi:hypothetical protein